MIKKLSLKPKSGLLTSLQSDTIFGHLCWRMVEKNGEVILKKFLGLYLDGKPVFTLSDGLFEVKGEVLFPKPLKQSPLSGDDLEKPEKIKKFLLRKEARGRKFITAGHLQLFLDGKMEEYEERFASEENRFSPSLHDDLRIHVRIDRDTMKSEDSMLFQTKPQYLSEETGFAVLIKVIDKQNYREFDVENILQEVFETGFGKKKSSGYGAFSILGFSDYDRIQEPEEGSGFLTLGNYLPSGNDEASPGYYDYFVKYGKLSETGSSGNNPFKKPMIMMKPGSCFETESLKAFYGRMTTPGEISSQTDVLQCGMPFTLNFKLQFIHEKTYSRVFHP